MPHQLMILSPDEVLPPFGDTRRLKTPDGFTHCNGVSVFMAEGIRRGGRLPERAYMINDVPASIAATLCDFEDNEGRALCER